MGLPLASPIVNFSQYGTGKGNDALLNYNIVVNTPNTQSSESIPLLQPYFTLTAASGDQSGTGVAYFNATLKLPDSSSTFGNVRRVIWSIRNMIGGVDFGPGVALNKDTYTAGTVCALMNMSSGQIMYFGPSNRDLFTLSVTDNHVLENLTIVSEEVISQGCLPFFANFLDEIAFCAASPGILAFSISLQLANFDIEPYVHDFGGGGYLSKSYS